MGPVDLDNWHVAVQFYKQIDGAFVFPKRAWRWITFFLPAFKRCPQTFARWRCCYKGHRAQTRSESAIMRPRLLPSSPGDEKRSTSLLRAQKILFAIKAL